MKYLLFSFCVVGLLSVTYAHEFPDLPGKGEEPVLATFAISIHIDRHDNAPIYQEIHLMTDLEQGFHLGKGKDVIGDIDQIDWRRDLVFVKITQIDPDFPASETISMIRHTDQGIQVKSIGHQSEDFAMTVAVN